jgi:hypothetical protein
VLERFVELLGGNAAEAWPLIQARDAKPVTPNRYVAQKRSAPAQRTTLRRSGPPRKRKLTPRRTDQPRDREYLDRVKALPCAARHMGECFGPVDPDHMGRKHMGLKASDYSAVPMCRKHHGEREDFSGAFQGYAREQMEAWKAWAIELTQLALGWGRPEATGVPW